MSRELGPPHTFVVGKRQSGQSLRHIAFLWDYPIPLEF